MENTQHECYIGIWNDYYSPTITLEELKSKVLERPMVYTLEQYFDWRYNTNLTRFVYCPYCGKKIDWKGMKDSIKNNDSKRNKEVN